MGRGARGTALQTSQAGYNDAQGYNKDLTQQNQSIQNYLLPQYKNLIQNPGYDQATKNAITTESTGAEAATFVSAADQAARTAARTGNAAALTPAMDKLAQEKAQTMADTNAKNQVAYADRAKADVTQGLQGISGLYGMDQTLLAKALGLPPEYLAAYNEANKSGSGTALLQSLIQGGAAVGAAVAGPHP